MRVIWLKDFEKKTPKQLLGFLNRNGFNKDYIIDCIVTCRDSLDENDLYQMTKLELCEKYREDIIDCLWNDLTSA